MKPIIEIQDVSKMYRIGTKESYYSLRDSVSRIFSRQPKQDKGEFWALKDVNFNIEAGQSIAIVGRNGAGKSTLLKILSQITPPTSGKITMRGRVASLLEVGTGFHPELTGRENIYLNGAILGMSRQEIKKNFDSIVDFAEVHKFLDTPVKRYSSGMYVRLAFAVAAHLEPEILIVDEVLAVGDAEFQRKCLGKMEEVGKEGRTVIFVSHNMGAVRQLCQQGVLLKNGKASKVMPIDELIALYQSGGEQTKDDNTVTVAGKDVTFTGLRVNDQFASEMPELFSGDAITISADYQSPKQSYDLCVGFNIKSRRDGHSLIYSHSHLENARHRTNKKGNLSAVFAVPMLSPGEYSVEMNVWLDGDLLVADREFGSFRILETPAFASKVSLAQFPSALMVSSKWEFDKK